MFKLWLPLWRQSVRISALFAFSQRASLSQSFAGVWLGREKNTGPGNGLFPSIFVLGLDLIFN